MALSMDEQRMLAEIERRLAAEDPGLAARLSSFKRPGPASKFRSPRSRIVGSMFAVAAALVLTMMVYAMIPFRAHAPKGGTNPQATGGVSVSAPANPASKPAAGSSHSAAPSSAAKTSAAKISTAKTSTAKTGAAPKVAQSAGASGSHAP